MKDIFGNKKPVQIEVEEWWFGGRIIRKQVHPLLMPYISFYDGDDSCFVATHRTFKEAINYCLKNPCINPTRFPNDYIGGIIFNV